MRLVVLGDFHLDPDAYELTRSAMEDIERLKPDLVVPLGDFGSKERIGGIEGLHEVKPFLDMISAPKRPILGNHDLQRESGGGPQADGTMEAELIKLYSLEKPYGVIEFDTFRLFFASTEPQPADSCYCLQECYVTDEQFQTLVSELEQRPGVPVVFFTHAPPIGCGLRTVPRVHVRSTNAYLDQNHDPYRWKRLFESYPEIVMWFSAHYHLGHRYPDSHTYRGGTHFFITGVHGNCTRDESRLSRLIDIADGEVRVRTIDHVKRTVTDEGAFTHAGPLQTMIGSDGRNAGPALSIPLPGPGARLVRSSACSVGESASMPYGVHAVGPGKYAVTTQDGFTWEVEPEGEAVIGTLHYGEPLHAVALEGDSLWMSWNGGIGRSQLTSPWRFVRSFTAEWPQRKWPADEPVLSLAPHPDGGVWAASAGSIVRFDPERETFAGFRLTLSAKPVRLVPEGRRLRILDEDGRLWCWDGHGGGAQLERENILAFDALDGETAMITATGQGHLLELHGPHGVYRTALPPIAAADKPDMSAFQLVCLGGGTAAAIIRGYVYYADAAAASLVRLPHLAGSAAAICRSASPDGGKPASYGFAVHIADDAVLGRPQLEVWMRDPQ
ncbi:metallophosphoesterase family protein [Paenibacillus hamazuiensis]|uniref:metallophosphoesterase family protein n=1 Tax=Paenibacillus hamazuiensis TaxID=2936508 RepID=UPI00200EE31F|nr:metallophosphoesterase [Paenibacillus hamazuiensis]